MVGEQMNLAVCTNPMLILSGISYIYKNSPPTSYIPAILVVEGSSWPSHIVGVNQPTKMELTSSPYLMHSYPHINPLHFP